MSLDEDRMEEIEQENQIWAEEKEKWSVSVNKLMHPRRFLRELSLAIPKEAIVTTDIGNNCSMTNDYFHFRGIRQHLAALSWGNCGFAMGAAIGAKMGRPEAAVFAFQGDGAYGIGGLAEVMTLVREEIPVIAIVANNFEWGAEKKNQVDFYGDRYLGTNLPTNPSYAELAQNMGALGFRVEDYTDVQDVVREAMASGKPCVIEGIIEGGKSVLAEPFRRDALKIPERTLEKYQLAE
jgi:sulfoacetaldehyde acetyltransferase